MKSDCVTFYRSVYWPSRDQITHLYFIFVKDLQFTIFFLGRIVVVLCILIFHLFVIFFSCQANLLGLLLSLEAHLRMHLLIWTITLLCFVVSVTAMTRRKGLVGRKLKKSKVLVSPSDDRPVVKPYLPPQMDNEERMPESRKRKASLSVDRDKVESSKEVIGYEGRRLAIGI